MTAVADLDFNKIIKEHSIKHQNQSKELLEKIKKVKATNPTVYHSKGINEFLQKRAVALRHLCTSYFRSLFKFPIIDPSIFDLKRHFYIDNNKIVEDVDAINPEAKQKHISCDLFAYTSLIHWPKQEEKTELVSYTAASTSWQRTRTKVIATLPPIPKKIENKIQETMATYHQTMATVYKTPEILSLIEGHYILPKFAALWIPSLKNLSVKTTIIPPKLTDPALIFEFEDNMFLIDTWDIEEEEPYENYIREFSIGDLGNTLRKKK